MPCSLESVGPAVASGSVGPPRYLEVPGSALVIDEDAETRVAPAAGARTDEDDDLLSPMR